jgi:hypothetical protein
MKAKEHKMVVKKLGIAKHSEQLCVVANCWVEMERQLAAPRHHISFPHKN